MLYVNWLAHNPKVGLKETSEKTVVAVAKPSTTWSDRMAWVFGLLCLCLCIITAVNDAKRVDEAKDRCIEFIQTKVVIGKDAASDEEPGDAKQEHDGLPEYIQKDSALAPF